MQDQAGAPLIPATPDQRGADGTPGPPLNRPAGIPATRRRALFLALATIAVITYGADQLSKAWAVRTLTDEPPRSLVGTFLQLDLIRNPGAAFSLGTGSTWVLTVIAVVVLVVIVRTSRRLGSTGWAWALGLLLGGALGNLTDRIVREPGFGQGHVVDFINYNGYFIGNVADIAIVSAAALIGILALTGRGVDGTRESRESRETREQHPKGEESP
ncbi:MAG: signal peptidase II [Lapillicoccus sp.]